MEEVSNLYIISDFTYAAENKHLIGLQLRYLFRRKIRSFDSIVRSHIVHEGTKNSWKSRGKLRFCDHVLMAVIAKSKGTPRSIVYVHYTGRLIDGTVFDTTEGDQLPALFMVGDLIMGW